MRGRGRLSRSFAFSILLVWSLIPAAGPVLSSPQQIGRAFASVAGQPDIVLVVTDDQRWDTLWAMPRVQELLAGRGITFANAFNTNPFCCPARASILKGAYSHGTRVYQNSGTFGPFPGFNDSSSIATWLDATGYRTALIGKYFNGYTSSRASYIPPGWDRWVAFAMSNSGGGGFTNYDLSVDGTLVHHGSLATDYSTDVLGGYADGFVRSTPADTPLFLMFTPYAPHQPAAVAARHAKAFPGLSPYRPPSYDEADVSDKPAFIRKLAPLAVDESVARIVGALESSGRLGNTMIVFASDNGYLLGEHRWGQKRVAYEESIRMPLVVRYDPLIGSARSDPNLVLNIDLAPTFAALAGVSAPGAEGSSLLGLLSDPGSSWRSDLLVENKGSAPPTYCGVRNAGWIYVQYSTGEEELYDLVADPYQLRNLVTDPAAVPTLNAMRLRLRELCSPPPPGFKFTH
jgi:N-acetylglucosamine-6-sulfatase